MSQTHVTLLKVTLPPSLEQREVTLSTGGGSEDMLIIPGAGVHVAQIMARSSHLASRCWCALVTKSTRHKQAIAALHSWVGFPDPWWPLRICRSHLPLFIAPGCLIFRCRGSWVHLWKHCPSVFGSVICSNTSITRKSATTFRNLHLTDRRPLTVVMKHHLGQKKLFQTSLTLKYRIY